jgi:hypothetical protein
MILAVKIERDAQQVVKCMLELLCTVELYGHHP